MATVIPLVVKAGEVEQIQSGDIIDLPNGSTGTTQAVADNSTKVATTAFVIANAGSSNNPLMVQIFS